MTDKLILVTGATGYIASRLIPRLLDSGYRVRALARHPHRLAGRAWFRDVDVIQADVNVPSMLAHAFDGVDTAYYLIHNMSQGGDYTALELDAARNFARTAEEAGVQHIIYLGGLADPEQHIAPHMRSRIETGRVLREGQVPVTEFRAGVIAGSGSISFEMIRFMTELFPIVPGPLWLKNKSQPIAIQNIIDYLVAALTNPNGQNGVFEIGGPEVAVYKDLMLRYACARGLKRRLILFPGIPVWFMAFGVALMTPVPYRIAHALVEGLSADSLVQHSEARRIFPEVHLVDYDTATRDALEKTHPVHIERVWVDPDRRSTFVKHEGCFIDHCEMEIQAAPEQIVAAMIRTVEERNWQIEMNEPDFRMIVRDPRQRYGKLWVEWRVRQAGSPPGLTQTVFFAPRGLPGFIHWLVLYPFHWMRFRGLIRGMAGQSQDS